ncbi:MAG: M48 family metallopeptidase [Bacteroidales bacterium]|nr:M48 family metallopeptidase [Bacteroidales bacterium]
METRIWQDSLQEKQIHIKTDDINNFKTLHDVWQYCRHIEKLPLDEIREIPVSVMTRLFFQAAKLLEQETQILAGQLDQSSAFCADARLVDFKWHAPMGRCEGSGIEIGFHALFHYKDFKMLQALIIHELCHTQYKHHGRRFRKLFEQSVRKAGIVPPDHGLWKLKLQHFAGRFSFLHYLKNKKYNLIRSHFIWNCLVYVRQPGNKYLRRYKTVPYYQYFLSKKHQGVNSVASYSYAFIQDLLHQSAFIACPDAKKKLEWKDLKYLSGEQEIFGWHFDSKLIKDENSIMDEYIEQIKADGRYDFSDCTSCIINWKTGKKHSLNLQANLEKLKEILINKNTNPLMTYIVTPHGKYRNKSEMTIVLSK